MSALLRLTTLPIRARLAAPSARTTLTPLRLNSTSTTRSATHRIAEMAAQAEKPSAFEASVPVMWALSGAAILTAWSRIDEKDDSVEKLLIV